MAAHPDIFEAALALPLDERGKLIHQLIESLEDGSYDDPEFVEAEWNAEIVRRARHIESGAVEGIPYEEVRRQFGR